MFSIRLEGFYFAVCAVRDRDGPVRGNRDAVARAKLAGAVALPPNANGVQAEDRRRRLLTSAVSTQSRFEYPVVT